jgi:hypothetical protein
LSKRWLGSEPYTGKEGWLVSSGASSSSPFDGDVNEFVNVLRAATTAAALRETKLGLKLAGHHGACPSGFADFRLGNSIAQAEVHGLLPWTIMRSILSLSASGESVNPNVTSILRLRLLAAPVRGRVVKGIAWERGG